MQKKSKMSKDNIENLIVNGYDEFLKSLNIESEYSIEPAYGKLSSTTEKIRGEKYASIKTKIMQN